jgi:predicted DNA-binding protein
LFGILRPVSKNDTMSNIARVNLNLPVEARQRLRSLAKAANEPEAVFARSLLVKAIERAERAAFRQQLEASRTPERRARDLKIAAAVEGLRG